MKTPQTLQGYVHVGALLFPSAKWGSNQETQCAFPLCADTCHSPRSFESWLCLGNTHFCFPAVQPEEQGGQCLAQGRRRVWGQSCPGATGLP